MEKKKTYTAITKLRGNHGGSCCLSRPRICRLQPERNLRQRRESLKRHPGSDGLNVVKTNAEGVYTLPGHKRERFIFITTPSDYRTDNQYYRRINGTGQTYDFGLQPWKGRIKPNGSHRFIHISDTEIFNTENQEDWANNIRDYAANENISFIIHTGDICYENG